MNSSQVFLVLLITSFPGLAQTPEWKLDKSHASVTFSVSHMVISEVMGQFQDFDVSLASSRDDFTDAVVEANIKVSSITTNNERRDNHLKTDDFFNAEKFPLITFRSTSVKKLDEKNYKIYGDLTIRDHTKNVVFDAVLGGILKTSRGVMTAWKATLRINRFDYGLKWDRTIETGGLVAGETVTIQLNLEFRKPST